MSRSILFLMVAVAIAILIVPLESQADDAYEQNDTRATAYSLSGDERVWLSNISGLGQQWDDDWDRIYVTSGFERVWVDGRQR